jgi:hypothetical protein
MYSKIGKTKLVKLITFSMVIGVLSTFQTSNASAAAPIGDANGIGLIDASLNVATQISAVVNTAVLPATATGATGPTSARSIGLISKGETTSATAQTLTIRPSGVLVLYAISGTSTSFTATGGSMMESGSDPATATSTTNITGATSYATSVAFTTAASIRDVRNLVAVQWTAPSTTGTYTINYYVRTATVIPTADFPDRGTAIGSITVTVSSSSHPSVAGTNAPDTTGAINSSLFVAVASNNTGAAAAHPVTTIGTGEATALSLGLLAKDSSYQSAQTATVLAGGKLSLYALVSTTAAFTSSGGSFASAAGINSTASYSESLRTALLTGQTPTQVGTVTAIWTAPSSAGTYTVSLGVGDGVGNVPTTSSPTPALAGSITVTVVAASAGGAYSAAYSACNTATTTTSGSATYPSGVDGITSPVANGGSGYIDFDIDDVYDAPLAATTNIVVSATNGAYVALGNAGSVPVAGSASTVVSTSAPTNRTVRVSQGAAGPVTTTVTITVNGTTVCTKTITIAGEVAKLTISGLGTQNLSTASTVYYSSRDDDGDGRTDGLFSVLATDSAGNIVAPNPSSGAVGTFSYDAATLTTTVQMVSVNTVATSSSSTSAYRLSLGGWTCGGTAGTSNVAITFTNTATGTVIKSAPFAARCAGNPATYTASFDKASYVQGDIATLTVKFLDSKGNPANQGTISATKTITIPMMTNVSTITGSSFAKADGSRSYTFTVGTSTGLTAGKYTGVVDYVDLITAGADKATPSYAVSTGGDTTTNADVLKSIVALIASINKQIQALQKLILKR